MAADRQTNHIIHHQASHSKTLMRRTLRPSDTLRIKSFKVSSALERQINAQQPAHSSYVDPARLSRATLVQRSDYVNHFTRPVSSSYKSTPIQPIKSVVHKPKVGPNLTIDELMLKAVDNIEDQLLNLEQQPLRRLHRFSRALVANRFNGIALD